MESNSKDKTIVDLVESLPRLRVFDEEIGKFEDNHFISTIPIADKNTYLGIEVETENVHTWHGDYSPYWRMTEDGSLRNSGREFVSIPIKAFRAENALRTLFDYQINHDIDFSERTSIHIHMNVRTLTLEQLKAMILLYLLFEKSLFRYVSKDRYNNIFCVPLNETRFGESLLSLFHQDTLSCPWTKYTALNLLPIFEKGTIEFRHLHGTKDVKEIIGWVNLILCLKKMALRNTPSIIWEKIETLNTSSQYHAFAAEVFGDFFKNINQEFLEKDMASCCTYIKTKCFQNPWTASLLKVSKDSSLFKFSFTARTSGSPFLSRQGEDVPFLDDEEIEREEAEEFREMTRNTTNRLESALMETRRVVLNTRPATMNAQIVTPPPINWNTWDNLTANQINEIINRSTNTAEVWGVQQETTAQPEQTNRTRNR